MQFETIYYFQYRHLFKTEKLTRKVVQVLNFNIEEMAV